jgi:hypothetical protein
MEKKARVAVSHNQPLPTGSGGVVSMKRGNEDEDEDEDAQSGALGQKKKATQVSGVVSHNDPISVEAMGQPCRSQ